ncbi:PHY domain-containing protein/HisKA domain-containing protein/PAS domain-containing protein/GAF domain-containing protein/HATPase_c domain-containing protein/PAS_2 domain-containing protein [Cephalotus follicularis]|uniref:Phytochrome n=2 Tax=Cephalotus follicularis TaxID=3775 RepID=A0A1Q3CG39_CEPFO|nr:PHY domain-containing protein/HisKA domain-containing protein/PAS domain-containing protein/GAF domain-containing protein/HATPase_c domain-containing protein/PAS_2 domain-containing protein [Cephalotus follicularis]
MSSRTGSARSKQNSRLVAQTSIDAKLHEDFEGSKKQFDYSASIDVDISSSTSNVPSSTVSAYLQKMQRGRLIQPFGCLIAVDKQNLKVLAYSENAPEMLDLASHAVPSIEQREALTFGTDVRTLFQSSGAAALQKAANFEEVNLLNPILVHCKTSGKPFYAILHRIDVGLVIDLEPVNPADVPVTAAGALKSYKLAAKAISRLQSLPGGNIGLYCDVLVKEVSDLMGYDRVMVYKFHDDEHGEVVADCHRPDLEPYLGLCFPATDIPQASRFLFMKNRVRMICDCLAEPVKVIQDKRLAQPLSLCGSTLRSPHGCHAQYMANMGSIASLVMSVTINEDDEEMATDQQKGRKLWGLVVCHHTNPRFVPFPLRYACEFLIQVFSVQINKEVELGAQQNEKRIMRIQTMLCDMLLRDAPVGIVTQSPNVLDLVKCDGAALYYRKKFWLLGVTPTEAQIKDIAEWLLEYHSASTGLSTDSLMEAGYPGASVLGNTVCGIAAVRITSKDFIFWFRSCTAKEIKWGGAKHDPGDKDDGRKMHPRSSFKAFMEVVKWRSLPWEDVEMDAIHSLQLILRSSLQDEVVEDSKMIINVPSVDDRIQKVDELRVVTNEMVRLIETAAVPILAVDASGNVNGWNSKAAELTGLRVEQAVGTLFVDLVEGDSFHVVKNMLSTALQGIEERNIEIKLRTFGPRENDGPVILKANACCSRDLQENVVGVCFVGQDLTGEKMIMEKYTRIQGDYDGIVRSPSALIPPIFMTDEHGRCTEWNDAMQKLSGLNREEATDRMLLWEVFTVNNFGCRVKDHDTLTKLKILFNAVFAGHDADKFLFGFFDQQGKYVEALLSANKRTDAEGRITGVLCFLHVVSPELQYAMQVQRISEQAAANSRNKLAYIHHEIRKPLSGIMFMQDLMGSSDLSKEQKQLLKRSILCQEQLTKILDDKDIESIDEGYMETNSVEFNLGETLEVVMKQVRMLSQERLVQIVQDIPAEVSTMHLYGDNLRLQQVLSDFLRTALLFTPAFESSSISFRVISRKKRIGMNIEIVHLEFWITQPAPGIPEDLTQEMFHHRPGVSREGLGLYISQRIVKIMNGTVQYLREAEKSSFTILMEFPLALQIERH